MLLVGVVSLVAGLIAASARASPTGHPLTDNILVGVAVALIAVIGSRAPSWTAGAAAGAALGTALDPLLMTAAAFALAAALWTRWRPGRLSVPLLAASVAVTFNVLARAELPGAFGGSTIVALAAAAVLFVLGTTFMTKRHRMLAWGGLALAALAAGAATAGFAFAAVKARHELSAGLTTAELGVSALESGDFDEAADLFTEAAAYLDTANRQLGAPWAKFASVVPIIAQHQTAVTNMGDVGAAGAATVAAAIDEIDVDDLRPSAGQIDVAALADLDDPLTRVRDAMDGLRRKADESRSPWLVNRAKYELEDFAASVEEHLPVLDNALAALRMAPGMLGADGPRTYLMLFTTPSEARGLGGFIGSYAELTIDDGQLTLGTFGRSYRLDTEAQAAGARVTGHDEFLRSYGRFGFNAHADGAGVVGDAAFRNLAMTPDFPTVAEIAADLYAQTKGTRVDGVIAMDPYVTAALLRYTGAVHVASLDQDVHPETAVPFLLREQYIVGDDAAERTDALAEAAEQAFDGLIAGALPDPFVLARDLGPLTSTRRLLVWSAHADEQDLIERVDIGGAIPPLDGTDGWSFTLNNAGGSKIDSFLERSAGYIAETDPVTGVTSATWRSELTNTAPAEGLPRYIIGNSTGEPQGTSRLWVTVYTPLGLDSMTVDGDAVAVEAGSEQGWNTYRWLIDVPPGASVMLVAELSGTVVRPDEVVTWTQPMSEDLEVFGQTGDP